jgi:formylmethanofuran dehydrogenase subunit C
MIWAERHKQMINPFLDFDNLDVVHKEIPLERSLCKNGPVIESIRAAYHRITRDSASELCRLLDHGQRFNRYKSMLPGIELPKLLTSTLTNAANVYDLCLRLIQPIDYAPDDIQELCDVEDLYQNAAFEQTGPLGIYLSALINACKEPHFSLQIGHFKNKLHFLGFRLEAGKRLSVHGDVGHFTGAGLRGGYLKVSGATGSWCGAEMISGSIEIGAEALSKTGARMKGGQIQVGGQIHEIAKDRRGGTIQCNSDKAGKPSILQDLD